MRLLARVVGLLTEAGIDHALIGALALAARGVARSTLDVDLLVLSPVVLDRRTWAAIADAAVSIEIRHGDADDPLEGVVQITEPGELPVDVVVGKGGWLRGVLDRAEPLVIAGARVPVVTAADLILLKLYAGGPSDRWDVEALLANDSGESLVREVESRLSALPGACQTLWDRIGKP